MKKRIGIDLIKFTWLICISWCAWGFYLFWGGLAPDSAWSIGELGDFFGGGLGGLAIIALLYTASLQSKQLEKQRVDMEETGLLRTYETLRPEAEGLSMRIISKLVKAKLVGITTLQFNEMAEKFRLHGDRTVFLRALKKGEVRCIIAQPDLDPDLRETIKRFEQILRSLDRSVLAL